MAKRRKGLEWLDLEDAKIYAWALNYLRVNGQTPFGLMSSWNADSLRAKGKKLEESAEGRELLGKMANAHRQEKWRKARPDLRSRTLRLQKKAATSLSSLAKKEGVTPSEFVSATISDAESAYKGMAGKLAKTKEREKEAKRSAGLREKGMMSRITGLETRLSDALLQISHYKEIYTHVPFYGPPSKVTQESVKAQHRQAWATVREELDAIIETHQGLHDMKRALTR